MSCPVPFDKTSFEVTLLNTTYHPHARHQIVPSSNGSTKASVASVVGIIQLYFHSKAIGAVIALSMKETFNLCKRDYIGTEPWVL